LKQHIWTRVVGDAERNHDGFAQSMHRCLHDDARACKPHEYPRVPDFWSFVTPGIAVVLDQADVVLRSVCHATIASGTEDFVSKLESNASRIEFQVKFSSPPLLGHRGLARLGEETSVIASAVLGTLEYFSALGHNAWL
jgi:hypothetical protein